MPSNFAVASLAQPRSNKDCQVKFIDNQVLNLCFFIFIFIYCQYFYTYRNLLFNLKTVSSKLYLLIAHYINSMCSLFVLIASNLETTTIYQTKNIKNIFKEKWCKYSLCKFLTVAMLSSNIFHLQALLIFLNKGTCFNPGREALKRES